MDIKLGIINRLSERDLVISNLVLDQASEVIIGAWNPAIVNPPWIAKDILGITDNPKMSLNLAVGASTNMQATIDEISFIPTKTL